MYIGIHTVNKHLITFSYFVLKRHRKSKINIKLDTYVYNYKTCFYFEKTC